MVYTGNKIMSWTVESTHSVHRFFQLSGNALSKFPATFQLTELKNGVFPHLCNTLENQAYTGPMLNLKYYDPDFMMPDRCKQLITWYTHEEHLPYVC